MDGTTKLWVKGRPAVKLSGRNVYDLQRLALAGRLRYRVLPGTTVEFYRDDLIRLAREER